MITSTMQSVGVAAGRPDQFKLRHLPCDHGLYRWIPPGRRSSAGVPAVIDGRHGGAIEWAAPPRRSAASIVDDRILTSCAAMRARMDGWWTLPSWGQPLHKLSRKKGAAMSESVLTPKRVLMDRSPDPLAPTPTARSSGQASSRF